MKVRFGVGDVEWDQDIPRKHFPEGQVRGCERCGEADIVVNIEAWEISGEIVCDECADQIFDENAS